METETLLGWQSALSKEGYRLGWHTDDLKDPKIRVEVWIKDRYETVHVNPYDKIRPETLIRDVRLSEALQDYRRQVVKKLRERFPINLYTIHSWERSPKGMPRDLYLRVFVTGDENSRVSTYWGRDVCPDQYDKYKQ